MHVLLCLVLVLLVQLEVPHVSPDHDVPQQGQRHQDSRHPAHDLPELVRVVQLAVCHLTAPLAPHGARAVWKYQSVCVTILDL